MVENLLSKKTDTVHARRTILYRADLDGVEVPESVLKHAEHTETQYETVHLLRDIRTNGNIIEVCVEWDGLPDT